MSEFGKDLTYCLGLFLSHAEREIFRVGDKEDFSLWFNGAADHFFEMDIPEKFPDELKNRLKVLRDKCLLWRLDSATKEDYIWAIQESKNLLLEIDRHYGIEVEKGEWE